MTVEIARRVLKPDSNIIDVGAHRGALLKELVNLAPRGSHIAVEPLPRHAQGLRRRFPYVTVHQIALSDTPATARFRKVIGSQERSSLEGFGHDVEDKRVEYFEVTVQTLDQIAPDRVDFLKIDAEGAEYNILRGANRVLAMRPFIAFELGDNQSKVYNLLTEKGFDVNLLSRWLNGEPPPPNVEALRHDVAGEYFFLAYPVI
jgi:FkbM family methyltransferase